jgi:transcriptional regulator with XRE-family HTH domain
MSKALDKINQIASETSGWKEDAKARQANKAWTKRSFKIAVRILREIRVQKPFNGMTQKKLAEDMGVSAQYINKVVKGKENLTLETISKIENILGISLIEVPMVETSVQVKAEEFFNKAKVDKNRSVNIGKQTTGYNEWNCLGYDDNYEATGTYG